MAAAVADFRPQIMSNKKIKKKDGLPSILLESTTDILTSLSSNENSALRPKIVVGFAAESQDLISNAKEKLISKNLDLIAANDISATDSGFGVDTNRVTLLFANRKNVELPLQSKTDIAEAIIQHLASLLENH